MSKDGTTAFDVPLREPGPLRKSTGSYPWRTDGDYNTLVTITNVAETPAQFVSFITYAGGELELPMQDLSPGQTASFDLRQMRDRLPGVTNGQFRWSIVRSGGETKLVGRAEVINTREASVTSYSCEVCCAFNPLQGYLSPGTWPVVIGGMADAIVHEPYADCYGWVHDSTFGYPEWWEVENWNVTTVWTQDFGLARASGDDGGEVWAVGSWWAEYTWGEWDGISPEYDCYVEPWVNQAPGVVQVRVPTALRVDLDEYTYQAPGNYIRTRIYQVMDQNSPPMPIQIPGLPVIEAYSDLSGNCGLGDVGIAETETSGLGRFIDDYLLDGNPPDPCTQTATQTITVAGRQVAQFTVTWTYMGVSVDGYTVP